MQVADAADQIRFYEDEHEKRWNISTTYNQDRYSLGVPLDVALVASGRPHQVALVGCGKRKAPTEAGLPAHQLYIGNPFRMGFKYASRTADDVHILSALHGLVDPFRLLAPYDMMMTQMTITEQAEWGHNVVAALKAAYPLTPINIVFYAGSMYVNPVVAALEPELGYWTYEDPLKGRDLFQRIRWFKSQESS